MLNLFESLFGGAFWICKYIDITHKKKKYNNRQNKASEITSRITATREQEIDIRHNLLDIHTRNTLLLSISDDLVEIYGANWRDNFTDVSEFDSQFQFIDYPWGVAFHLLLSKHGLKPGMFSTSYSLMGNDDMVKRKIKVCEMIEKNIQIFHPKLYMIFVPDYDISSPNRFDELYKGSMWWEYEVPDTDCLWDSHRKRLW